MGNESRRFFQVIELPGQRSGIRKSQSAQQI